MAMGEILNLALIITKLFVSEKYVTNFTKINTIQAKNFCPYRMPLVIAHASVEYNVM